MAYFDRVIAAQINQENISDKSRPLAKVERFCSPWFFTLRTLLVLVGLHQKVMLTVFEFSLDPLIPRLKK